MSVDKFFQEMRHNTTYAAYTIADLYTTKPPNPRAWCLLSSEERYVSHEPYTQQHAQMFREDITKMLEGKQLIVIDRNRGKLFTSFDTTQQSDFLQLATIPYSVETIPPDRPLIDLFKEILPDPLEEPTSSCLIA